MSRGGLHKASHEPGGGEVHVDVSTEVWMSTWVDESEGCVRERGWTRFKGVIRENGKRSSDPSGGGWIGNGGCEKEGSRVARLGDTFDPEMSQCVDGMGW